MTKPILITSALPYANGTLHVGHMVGAYLPACIFARYLRMKSQKVLYICGSDEYGAAITLSAEQAGRTPQEQASYFHALNRALFAKMAISFDFYSRTTNSFHAPRVQAFFKDLLDGGFLEERRDLQLYSVADHRFLADRYVVGRCPKCGFNEARGDECTACGASYDALDLIEPRSKLTGSLLEKRETTHFYMRYDLFKEKLTHFLEEKNWKGSTFEFSKQYLAELRPRAITRDLDWGVPLPLPGYEGKVIYVWFDAPIGYISATEEWAADTGHSDAWKEYWCNPETELVQFMGKDNLVFHTLLFPAMIMGQKQPYKLVDRIIASEFLTLQGRKISKSEGHYFDLGQAIEKYGSDIMRYVLASIYPDNKDADFSWEQFGAKVNDDLVGKLGNLIHRVLHFIYTKREGKLLKQSIIFEEVDAFSKHSDQLIEPVMQAYEKCRLRELIFLLMEFVSIGNRFFDQMQPWHLLKDPASHAKLDAILYAVADHLKKIALLMHPVIPESTKKLWSMLGYSNAESMKWDYFSQPLPDLIRSEMPQPLFARIEKETIMSEIEALAKTAPGVVETNITVKEPQPSSEVTIDEFIKIENRVAKIIAVEAVPKSKKLYKIQLDLGFEKRQVVSGIALAYPDPELLLGKQVIVVSNLKPTSIMGVESRGMLLCGQDGERKPVLLECPGAVIGSLVS